MNSSGPIRLLGLSQQQLTMQDGQVRGKGAGYYNAFARRSEFEFLTQVTVRLSQRERAFGVLRHAHRGRSQARIRAQLSPQAFKLRSQRAEALLQAWEGRYDVLMQLHTLLSPGVQFQSRVYVLATDNTYAMSLKHWPAWVNPDPDVSAAWMQLEGEVYRRAQFVFTWSEFARASMIADYGVPEDRVVAVCAGANLIDAEFTPKGYANQTALFVGNDFERKGGLVLLQAWETVARELPDAQLLIVGPTATPAHLPPNVQWIGRVSDRAYLRSLYDRSGVFVMPSWFEPYGLSFLEAMGLGLSCIGAATSAMPEIIAGGETGQLVPPGDADALAAALIAVLRDPDLAERLGRAAHAKASRDYTWDAVADRIAPYIVQAAQARRSG